MGVGGGIFGIKTMRKHKKNRRGEKMALKSNRDNSESSSLKVTQAYRDALESDTMKQEHLFSKRRSLNNAESAGYAAHKARFAQAKEKRKFFGEFHMRDQHRQKLRDRPLRRISEHATFSKGKASGLLLQDSLQNQSFLPKTSKRRSEPLSIGSEPTSPRPPSQAKAPLYRAKQSYLESLDHESSIYNHLEDVSRKWQLLIDIYLIRAMP